MPGRGQDQFGADEARRYLGDIDLWHDAVGDADPAAWKAAHRARALGRHDGHCAYPGQPVAGRDLGMGGGGSQGGEESDREGLQRVGWLLGDGSRLVRSPRPELDRAQKPEFG